MLVLHRLSRFLFAVVVTAVSGSIVQSQFNLLALHALDVDLPAAVWLGTTARDIGGFAPFYALIVAVAFLVALPVAALLTRRLPMLRMGLYPLAGATAILAALLAVNALLSISAIAATRSLAGLLAMALTGALGGFTFSRFRPSGRSAPH